MSDTAAHQPRRTDAKLWLSIGATIVGAAVAWGSLQQTVNDYGRRITVIEGRGEKRVEIDNQILQRLTAIETKLEDVRANMKGQH